MARRTKSEAEETRESILDAAELEFLENGVSRTTLERIARRAGVTRGAVYWHFRDKNDLFAAMVERVRLPLQDLIERIRHESVGDPLTVTRNLCLEVLSALDDSPRDTRVYTILATRCEFVAEINPTVERQRELDDEALAHLTADFEAAHAEGLLRANITPRIAALALRSLMAGIFNGWLRDPGMFDLRTDGAAMLDAFFDGLRA